MARFDSKLLVSKKSTLYDNDKRNNIVNIKSSNIVIYYYYYQVLSVVHDCMSFASIQMQCSRFTQASAQTWVMHCVTIAVTSLSDRNCSASLQCYGTTSYMQSVVDWKVTQHMTVPSLDKYLFKSFAHFKIGICHWVLRLSKIYSGYYTEICILEGC